MDFSTFGLFAFGNHVSTVQLFEFKFHDNKHEIFRRDNNRARNRVNAYCICMGAKQHNTQHTCIRIRELSGEEYRRGNK